MSEQSHLVPSDLPLAAGIPDYFWDEGPYVTASCFCEKVIQDKVTGAHSIISLIEGISASVQLVHREIDPMPNLPGDIRFPIRMTAFIMLTGIRPGTKPTLAISIVDPSGRSQTLIEQAVFGSGTFSGINISAVIDLATSKSGVHSVELRMTGDDTTARLLTRIPILVNVDVSLGIDQPGEER